MEIPQTPRCFCLHDFTSSLLLAIFISPRCIITITRRRCNRKDPYSPPTPSLQQPQQHQRLSSQRLHLSMICTTQQLQHSSGLSYNVQNQLSSSGSSGQGEAGDAVCGRLNASQAANDVHRPLVLDDRRRRCPSLRRCVTNANHDGVGAANYAGKTCQGVKTFEARSL